MAPIGATKQHEELFSGHHRLTAIWLVIFYHLIMWIIQKIVKSLVFLHYLIIFNACYVYCATKTICVLADSDWYFLLHVRNVLFYLIIIVDCAIVWPRLLEKSGKVSHLSIENVFGRPMQIRLMPSRSLLSKDFIFLVRE